MLKFNIEQRYIFYKVFRHTWFIGAVWLLFYRLFMTDQSVGILDAISFGLGLLAEIPSGALADRYGRKRLTIIGIILAGLGFVIQGLASGYALILLGQTIVTMGWAFSSGADDALFYDEYKKQKYAKSWKSIVIKASQAGLIATLSTYLIGGYLYNISPRLPFIAAVISLLSILALIGIDEQKSPKKNEGEAIKEYLEDLKDGVKQFGKLELRAFLPVIIIVQGLFYSFGYGLLRPILLTRFNFDASGGAWVLFWCGVITIVLQRLQLKHIDSISERVSISSIIIISAFMLFMGVFNLGILGFVVILALYSGEYLLEPIMSHSLNDHIESRHRATALSASAFLKSLPYVISAPLIGALNTRGALSYYLISMSIIFIIVALVFLGFLKTKNSAYSR